jgi:hypothetical protein
MRSDRRQPAGQLPVGEQHPGPRLLEHALESLRRLLRVQRQVGRSRHEDADQRDHHLQRSLQAHADDAVGAHAERPQLTGQSVRPVAELGVAQLLAAEP